MMRDGSCAASTATGEAWGRDGAADVEPGDGGGGAGSGFPSATRMSRAPTPCAPSDSRDVLTTASSKTSSVFASATATGAFAAPKWREGPLRTWVYMAAECLVAAQPRSAHEAKAHAMRIRTR